MNGVAFQNYLRLSSVPLVRLDDKNMPTGIASGCLIDYGGKRVLLTVFHATGDQRDWAIALKSVTSQGAQLYFLGQMNFLAKGSLSKPGLDDVDFAYVEVPPTIQGYRQEIEPPANTVKSEDPIIVHTPTLEDIPEPCQEFGFSGMVMPATEVHFGQRYLGLTLRVYSQLGFLRTENDHEVFSLPFAHAGSEHFEGCSGAPILSSTGELVALVRGGLPEKNEIWGISIKAYKAPIDILVGKV